MDWRVKLKLFVMEEAISRLFRAIDAARLMQPAGHRRMDFAAQQPVADDARNTMRDMVGNKVKLADKPGSVVDSHSSRRFVT